LALDSGLWTLDAFSRHQLPIIRQRAAGKLGNFD